MSGDTGSRAAAWAALSGVVLLFLGMVLLAAAASGGRVPTGGPLTGSSAVIAFSALAVAGALLALLGLALYVLIPAFAGPERARKDYGSHRVVLACTALAVILGNVLALAYFVPAMLLAPSAAMGPAGSDLTQQMLSPTGIAVAAVSLDVALLFVVYLRVVRPGAITWSTMGLTTDYLGGRLLLGFLLGLVLFAVSSVIEALLSRAGIQQTQSATFQSVTRAGLGGFGLIILAGAVIAPVVEEIYFRGYVFRAYLEQKGSPQAFLFSSALFALAHTNIPAFLPIFAMGLLLAFIYYRTGSIVPAITAHAVNNAAAFTLLYLGLT